MSSKIGTTKSAPRSSNKNASSVRNPSLIPPADKKFTVKKPNTDRPNNTTTKLPVRSTTSASLSIRNKNTLKSNLVLNKTKPSNDLNKIFDMSKKKLTESQNEFVNVCKKIREEQEKNFNPKLNMCLDKIQLYGLNGDYLLSSNEKEFVKNSRNGEENHEKLFEQIEEIKQKLNHAAEKGFKICNNFIIDIKNFNDKLTQAENEGDQIPVQCVKDVLEKIISSEIHLALDSKEQQNIIRTTFNVLNNHYENLQKDLDIRIRDMEIYQESLDTYKKKCENFESFILKVENDYKSQIDELNRNLNKKENKIIETETRIKDFDIKIKSYKEKMHSLEEQLSETKIKYLNKTDEMNSKDRSNNEMIEKVKLLTDKLDAKQIIIDELTKIKELYCQQQNYKQQLDEEKSKCEYLENLLKQKEEELNNQMQENRQNCNTNSEERLRYAENQKEIQSLKYKIELLTKDKKSLEKSIEHLESINSNKEFNQMAVELKQLQEVNKNLQHTLNKMEDSIFEKNSIIEKYEERFSAGGEQLMTNETLTELTRLRELEANKQLEIDHLKSELSKFKVGLKQSEETILMHQRLLKIRSELIDSLQEKEANAKYKMDNLYSELNTEILTKTDEFQSIYSTLTAKQLEISKQEQIIKTLEENDIRNEQLKTKQEERIKRLENEISHLRHVIILYRSIYQELNPKIDFKEVNSTYLERKSSHDLNISREFFDSERKQKRTKKIEVKQIIK